jgi:predicted nucleic acid-binding protein
MIIIDTDIAINIIHASLDMDDMAKIIEPESKIAITSPSMYELYFGLYRMEYRRKNKPSMERIASEKKAIDHLEKILIHIPFNNKDARLGAQIFNELLSKGEEIDIFDCMISAIVLRQKECKILTNNREHFKRIRNLEIISM